MSERDRCKGLSPIFIIRFPPPTPDTRVRVHVYSRRACFIGDNQNADGCVFDRRGEREYRMIITIANQSGIWDRTSCHERRSITARLRSTKARGFERPPRLGGRDNLQRRINILTRTGSALSFFFFFK